MWGVGKGIIIHCVWDGLILLSCQQAGHYNQRIAHIIIIIGVHTIGLWPLGVLHP